MSARNGFSWQSLRLRDGEFEYIFEADEQNVPKTVSQEKAADIAADWVTVFYHVQAGVIETQEFITSPIPHWLFLFLGHVSRPDATNAFRRTAGKRHGQIAAKP